MASTDPLQKVGQRSAGSETRLCDMRLDRLRNAIRKNQVTFPSQVPTFAKHDRPDLQQKLSQLYFVLGWNAAKIGARFGVSRLRVQQILNTWKKRAIEVGYIQSVPPVESLMLPFEHPPIRIVLSPGESSPDITFVMDPALREFDPGNSRVGASPTEKSRSGEDPAGGEAS